MVITPVISPPVNQKTYPDNIKIAFTAFNSLFTLDLKQNKQLFHPNLNGAVDMCHYTGKVRCAGCGKYAGAAVSICNNKTTGVITTGTNTLFIEPILNSHLHEIYSSKHSHTREMDTDELIPLPEMVKRQVDRIRRGAVRMRSSHYFIEVMLVVDRSMQIFHGAQLEAYLHSIMNMVDSMLAHPSIGNSIRLVLKRLVVLPSDSESAIKTDTPTVTLANFCLWNKKHYGEKYDLAVYITNDKLCTNQDCRTVGVAYPGGICLADYSCMLIQDQGLTLTGFTITHEIGHSLNMGHDTENMCPTERGIMATAFLNSKNPYSWSRCSRQAVTRFFSTGGGQCLRNRPTGNIISRPQPILTADQQCQALEGPLALACPSSTCSHLQCRLSDHSCIGYFTPMQEGSNCTMSIGVSGVCQKGECLDKASMNTVDGEWSDWGAWSSCTHTCGNGIHYRERQCSSPEPANGGAYCTGDYRVYQECNTQACQPPTQTRRDKICSEITEYGLMLQELDPEASVNSPCNLYCYSSILNSIVKGSLVPDGTECFGMTPYQGVCIAGQCHKYDCTGEFGGNVTLDRCGVCGGDGSTCELVIDAYDSFLPIFGVHHIVTLPVGAANVILVDSTKQGYATWALFLSGANDYSGLLTYSGTRRPIAGDKWNYISFPNGTKIITTKGPLMEPIELKLYAGWIKTNINISYRVPTHSHVAPLVNLNWPISSPYCTSCSATCGPAYKLCKDICVNEDGTKADTDACLNGKGTNYRVNNCELKPCTTTPTTTTPTTTTTTSTPTTTTPTSTTTATTTPTTTTTTTTTPTTTTTTTTTTPTTPTTTIPTTTTTPTTPTIPVRISAPQRVFHWIRIGWSNCSAMCGYGSQMELNVCKERLARNRYRVVSEDFCKLTTQKPQKTRLCKMEGCVRLRGSWTLSSDWSACRCSVVPVPQAKKVWRCTAEGRLVPSKHCTAPQPTAEYKSCESECQAVEMPTWNISEWKACVSCYRRRSVSCELSGVQVRGNVCRKAGLQKPVKKEWCC